MQQSSPDSHLSSNLVIALTEKKDNVSLVHCFFLFSESISVNKLAKAISQHLSVFCVTDLCALQNNVFTADKSDAGFC